MDHADSSRLGVNDAGTSGKSDTRLTHACSRTVRLPAPSRMHSLNRTSPKGGPFIGVCSLCGKAGLTLDDIHNDECENPRGLSQDDAVVEAIVGPVPNGDRENG